MTDQNEIQWINKMTVKRKQAWLPRTFTLVETPLGMMTLVERGGCLCELRLDGESFECETLRETQLLAAAARELTEYFAGERVSFSVPLAPMGTPFQLKIWRTLYETVPYGHTVSYGELARRADKPNAARAVGMANHYNPLPIFIPCHRVIGKSGKLVGYGGGLHKKEALLQLEAEHHQAK